MSEIHVFEYEGFTEVWLDTEVATQDGICIGSGPTRDAAVAAAVQDLEAALERLQEPPAADETWNTCPDCGTRWKDDTPTPGLLHRTRLCDGCALNTTKEQLAVPEE